MQHGGQGASSRPPHAGAAGEGFADQKPGAKQQQGGRAEGREKQVSWLWLLSLLPQYYRAGGFGLRRSRAAR